MIRKAARDPTAPISSVRVVFVSRLFAALLLIALATSHSFVWDRVVDSGGVQEITLYGVYWLWIGVAFFLAIRIPNILSTVVAVSSRVPVRSAVLVLNITIVGLLVLNVFSRWGVIVLMFVAALGFLAWMATSQDRRFRVTDRIVRFSPLSFGVIYAVLGAGETVLRFRPLWVGGGGGGNPALRQLYAGLYSTNTFGLRDDELTLDRPDGTFRILALGDSYTFGQMQRERRSVRIVSAAIGRAGGSATPGPRD